MKLDAITDGYEPTEEMIKNFKIRTETHIRLVSDNLHKLAKTNKKLADELLSRAAVHDESKYGDDELIPYIWLTEYHRCKSSGEPFSYPSGMESKVKAATWHHITTNKHHPEAHEYPGDMSECDIIEMVCDWTAMAQELGQNGGSALQWADDKIGSKWEFNQAQIKLIYDTINLLDGLNSETK